MFTCVCACQIHVPPVWLRECTHPGTVCGFPSGQAINRIHSGELMSNLDLIREHSQIYKHPTMQSRWLSIMSYIYNLETGFYKSHTYKILGFIGWWYSGVCKSAELLLQWHYCKMTGGSTSGSEEQISSWRPPLQRRLQSAIYGRSQLKKKDLSGSENRNRIYWVVKKN